MSRKTFWLFFSFVIVVFIGQFWGEYVLIKAEETLLFSKVWYTKTFIKDHFKNKYVPSYEELNKRTEELKKTNTFPVLNREEIQTEVKKENTENVIKADEKDSQQRPQPVYLDSQLPKNVIATVSSPVKNINYELNAIVPSSFTKEIKVYWTLYNTGTKPIIFSKRQKNLLHPSKLYVVDFESNRRFSLLYDRNIAHSNCLIDTSIRPGGRINCSAVVGPQFNNIQGLRDNRISIYLPGKKKNPIKIFLDI